MNFNSHKRDLLFVILGSFFITNALLAEFIGVKIFSLEQTIGLTPANIRLLGFDLSFNLTAGVILWPFVFIMTDIINEYYGMKGVKLLSILAAILIGYSFIVILGAMNLYPAAFWVTSVKGVDMNASFNSIFGQGAWIIAGSITAFIVGQFFDVYIFHIIKKTTGEKMIWLRATGSTLISQLIDSFIVLFIAFYIGAGWELKLVLAICIMNYIYKFIMAILLTPLLYIIRNIIEKYLGANLAAVMKQDALGIKTA